jgi:raw score 10.54
MNHVFKNIWNAVNQCWTAVSELSKSAGKSSKTDKRKVLNAIIGAAVLAGVSTTAIAETNVVSDDQGNVIGGIGAKALAGTGTTGNSVVLGNKAKSERTESVVIGSNATNTGRWSVTLGDKADGNSQYGVTIGNRAHSGKGGNAIAIGLMAKATNEKVGGNSQTAVGVASYADGEGASAFGATANATGALATAVGRNSKALAKSASAFGDSASASAWGATAVGIGASAKANNSIAVGSQAVTEGQESTALGRRSYAGAQSATALGTGANASAIVSTAVGNGAKASAVQASALGNEAKATGSSSTAIGVRSNSAGSSAIAVGTNSAASANNAVSIGTGSKATGSESTAIGYASKAEGVNSMAMGRESSATHENSVALGSYSVSKAEKSVKEATVGTIIYNGFAGTAPKGTVSVGTKGRERQIVNVAAGEISATSTDAINGSQLYAVATKIGQSAKAPVVEAGKLITVETSTNANGQTVYTVSGTDFQPAIDANKANIAKNADAINTNTADIRSAEKLIDMNAKDIAQNTKDVAANTNYIKAVEQKLPVVTAGKNTTVDISTDANGKVTYTVNSADYQPAIDKNTKGIADNTKAIESNKAKIADVEAEAKRHTVVEAGHNMEVTSSKDENGATVYKVATSKDIGVNSLTVYNGPKITKDGIDARNTKIKNVTAGVDDNDAVNVSQLNQVKARQDAQSRALKQVRRTVINHGARLANVENRVSGLENKVDRLDHDVKKNRKRADAGISAVAAMANIPQVYLPGKSGVGVGVGYKHGQSAVAVGYSRSSDNGHHIIKLSAGVDTQKDVTVGAGYMYQW